ncbi:hypothetical protein I7I48_11454 [Histoplasma ohiense]|nr:hypothetical protein I7I48_11454 [Histoplasma ohiense (nom. inval.)]
MSLIVFGNSPSFSPTRNAPGPPSYLPISSTRSYSNSASTTLRNPSRLFPLAMSLTRLNLSSHSPFPSPQSSPPANHLRTVASANRFPTIASPLSADTAPSPSAIAILSPHACRFPSGLLAFVSQATNAAVRAGYCRAVFSTVAPPRLTPMRAAARCTRRASRMAMMSAASTSRVMRCWPQWRERPRAR